LSKISEIKLRLKELRLYSIETEIEDMINSSEIEKIGFAEYTLKLLNTELESRESRRVNKNIKIARLPHDCNLETYDFNHSNGLNIHQINQLKELNWLSQKYNLLILGPPGVGKTYLAAGLGCEAVKNGYEVIFRTMAEIITILKLKDITRSAGAEYKRIIKAQMIIIDDMMILPMEKQEAVKLFQLIDQVYENASIIITSNKDPKGWAEMMQDEVLTTAILDRLMHRCQPINLNGDSYRMAHRKTIFK